jgi:hypothetical protein
MALDLALLVAGAVVRLPGANGPVRLISVEPGTFWSFVYEHPGGLDRITLSEEELAEVEFVDVAEAPAFDGDPYQFRLGLAPGYRTQRIRMDPRGCPPGRDRRPRPGKGVDGSSPPEGFAFPPA